MSDPVAARLRATPAVQRTPTPKLDLFRLREFLAPEICAALMTRIDANRQPSTIADNYGGDSAFRTSETCHFDPNDPVIADVDARLAALLGIDPALGEPLQGQRYAVGQEFKAHTDYFEPGGDAMRDLRSVVGQRTWTAMIYLNAPDAGGATRFKAIKKSVQPEAGALLAWNNRRPDGSVNPSTIHHGMKVRAGTKYVVTKWYSERPWPVG
ncbi:MAG: 2OG-Fe(II) oxygenase [Pseudomonadota bacterium]